ncbi:unnamed protein product [Dibothriocephalus latus]|uniref:NR LBD domain-containing protein n=1 Tax=Dibothriocephalus latus TaxID=60516 RepID=A0A3P7LEL5_DIBLA|nr:unnamed protein product [Dibothriocephalus latus]
MNIKMPPPQLSEHKSRRFTVRILAATHPSSPSCLILSWMPARAAKVPQGRTIWPEKVDEHRIRMHETLSGLLAPHIQHVVEFAKRIPDFGHLGQPDQLVLIKAAFFEVWITQAAKTFSSTDRTVIIGDGRQIAKQELDFIYSVSLYLTREGVV